MCLGLVGQSSHPQLATCFVTKNDVCLEELWDLSRCVTGSIFKPVLFTWIWVALSYSAKNWVFNNSSKVFKVPSVCFCNLNYLYLCAYLLSIIVKAFFQMTHLSVLNTWITTVVKGLFIGRWKTAGNSMHFRLCYISDTMLKRKSSWSVAYFFILSFK